MNRKIILLPLSFAAILALAACNPGTTATSSSSSEPAVSSAAATVTSVTVTAADGATTVDVNKTLQLTAAVVGTGNPSTLVSWTSSSAAIATVSATGLVTGVASGSVTITATSKADSTKTGTIVLSIVEKIDKISAINAIGTTYTIKAVVVGKDLQDVAFSDGTGIIYAYFKGTEGAKNQIANYAIGDYFKIVGQVGNYYKVFQFYAEDGTDSDKKSVPAFTATKLTETAPTIDKTAVDFTPAMIDAHKASTSDWSNAAIKFVKYQSILTIEPVTGKTYNTYKTLVGTYDTRLHSLDTVAFPNLVNGGLYDIVGLDFGWNSGNNYQNILVTSLTKVDVPVTGLAITGADSVAVGDTTTLSVTATPAGADATVTWSSSDETKATVDAKGVVAGVALGTGVVITATSTVDTTIKATTTIDVIAAVPATGVTLAEGATYSLPIAVKHTFSATVAPAEASQKIAWVSSDTAVATVDATGVVTPLAVGTTNITITTAAKDSTGNHLTKTLALTVTAEPQTITMTPAEAIAWGVAHKTTGSVYNNEAYVSISGILENRVATDVNGGCYITDPATGDSVVVYKSTGTADTLSFAKGYISFSKPADADKSLAGFLNGEKVTIKALIQSYKGLTELQGIISTDATTHAISTDKYTASVTADANGTATLDKVSGIGYGDTITVTCAPKTGYAVESVSVTGASGVATKAVVSATDAKVYTFSATCVNKVAVTFKVDDGSQLKTIAIAATSFTFASDGSSATLTDSPITLLAEKLTSSTAFNQVDTSYFRIYAKSGITVSVASGTLKKIVFTCTSASYATALAAATITGGTAVASDTLVTITPTANTSVSSVKLVVAAQARVSSVDVTYIPA